MAEFTNLKLTKDGEEYLGRALVEPINFTTAIIKLSTQVVAPEDIPTLTVLNTVSDITPITQVQLNKSTNTLVISARFNNLDIKSNTTINTIGLFVYSNGTEKLIAATTATVPLIVRKFNKTANFYNLKLSLNISSDSNTPITITDGNFASIDDINRLESDKQNKLKPGRNILINNDGTIETVFQEITDIAQLKGEKGDKGEPFLYKDFTQPQLDALKGQKGDGSVEVEQARIDARGHINATLKERLDKEHNEVATQLAQTEQELNARVSETIANAGDGTLPTEVVDMRTVGGKTYTVAGDALRALHNNYSDTVKETVGFNLLDDTLATLDGSEYYNSPFVPVPPEKRISISTQGKRFAYITNVKWYDSNLNEILPAPQTPYAYTYGLGEAGDRSAIFITTPANCAFIKFRWRFLHASSGDTLATLIMVNVNEGESDTVSLYQPFETTKSINPELITQIYTDIETTIKNVSDKIVYVSLTGSDSNDGKTPETAFGSFERASAEKPTIIYAERGVYKYDRLTINNQDSFTLLPYTNDDEYSHDKPIRSKIVIDNGNTLTNLTSSDGLLEQAVVGGAFFNQVFIDKTMDTMLNSKSPRAVLWQEFDDKTLNTRLKPVLTKQEVMQEEGTFTWDGTKIFINPLIGDTSAFVVAQSHLSVLDIKNTKTVAIEDVEVSYQFYNSVNLHNVGSSDVRNTHAKYTNSGQGFSIDNTNANLYNCTAFKVGNDGFNMHGYGDTNFFNCKGIYCYDDGMSHHYGCSGTVHGGEYSFNGKGGILPAYGSDVDIYNTICDGNFGAGIGYLYTPNGHKPVKGFINGNLLINNGTGLSVGSTSEVISVNTTYVGNTTEKKIHEGGVLREY